jgi:hypothetical protein
MLLCYVSLRRTWRRCCRHVDRPAGAGATVRRLAAEGCGITLPPFLEWSDPHVVVDIAVDAEGAGWDGVFLWDHVTWNPAWGGTPPMADPWMCLAAAATATFRVLLGTVVTSLPRRRPQDRGAPGRHARSPVRWPGGARRGDRRGLRVRGLRGVRARSRRTPRRRARGRHEAAFC